MPDNYTPQLSVSSYEVGGAVLTVTRSSGTNCPALSFKWKNITPFDPLGCTKFRLVSPVKFDSYYGYYPPCDVTITPDYYNGLISVLDFTTDTANEKLSGSPVLSDGGSEWGAFVETNGKFGGGYRHQGVSFGTVPLFQGRAYDSTGTAPTTIAAWVSNRNGRAIGNESNGEIAEFTFEAASGGRGGIAYRTLTAEIEFAAEFGVDDISGGAWAAGAWVAMIITHDPATSTLECYLDNTLIGSIVHAENITPLAYWQIRGSVTVAYVYERLFTAADRAAFQALTAPITLP